MKIPSVAQLGLVSALIIVSVWVISPVPFMMEPNADLSVDQAKLALKYLRQAGDSEAELPIPAELDAVGDDVIPIVMTVWVGGGRRLIRQVSELTLREALEELALNLRARKRELSDRNSRIQLDFALSRGWIPDGGVLFSVSFIEGRTGVSGEINGERVFVAPAELIRQKRYGTFAPLPGYDARFKIGVSKEKAQKAVAYQGRQIGKAKVDPEEVESLERFDCLTVVEGADRSALRLMKGTVERPDPSRRDLERAVREGADYLVRALGSDGMFRYHYAPLLDRNVRDPYNWPRHAGTAYSLALVGRILEEPRYTDAAKRALARFEEQLTEGPEGSRCLLSRGNCYLGSSALGLLALAEYRIASGDSTFDATGRQVAAFLEQMVKDDGFFYHTWYPEEGIDKEHMKLYASQQAVFALGRWAAAVDDEEAYAVAERGMDYLAGPYWDFFLGSYFFGMEHWTCLAAEEMYKKFPKPEYAEICLGIGTHYDNITHEPGETPFPEDVGGMSITHFFTPHAGGTATATEAMVSALILGEATGTDVDDIRAQVYDSYAFLLRDQISEDDLFWMPDKENALGGFFETQSKPTIRIDNVQHSISAIVRGMDLVSPR